MNGVVYCATNRENGKRYVGTTRRLIGAKARERMAAPGSKEIRSEKMKRFYSTHPEAVADIACRAAHSALASDPARMWNDETRAKRAATVADPEHRRAKSEATKAGIAAAQARKIAAGTPLYCKTKNYRPATAGTRYSLERCAEISARQSGKKRGHYKDHHEAQP